MPSREDSADIIKQFQDAFLSFAENYVPEKGTVTPVQVPGVPMIGFMYQPPISGKNYNGEIGEIQTHLRKKGLLEKSLVLSAFGDENRECISCGDPSRAFGLSLAVRVDESNLESVRNNIQAADREMRFGKFTTSMQEKIERMLVAGVSAERVLTATTQVLEQWREALKTGGALDVPEQINMENRLEIYKSELIENISSSSQQGLDPHKLLECTDKNEKSLQQAIEQSRDGGSVISHWAKATNRRVPSERSGSGVGRS